MIMSVDTYNLVISSLTVVSQIILIFGLVVWGLSKTLKKQSSVIKFLSKHAGILSLIVMTIATLGSLYYSEIIGYEPCKLCWIQRIFIYPQVLIIILGIYFKDSNFYKYIFGLSLIAFVVAVYHYSGQWSFASLNCGIELSSDCAKKFVFHFGYITIPLMSASASALVMFFSGLKLINRK